MDDVKINSLSDDAIRKVCELERGSKFDNAPQPEQPVIPVSSKPFQRYVITDENGDIGDQSSGALEPCGMAYAREMYFELGDSPETLSKGCWKPCQTPVQKIYDSHGQTFALQGDMVLACTSDQGRLETFQEHNTKSVTAVFQSGTTFEIYRCGNATGLTVEAEISPDDEWEADEEALLNYTPIYNFDDCEDCGCWSACKKKVTI